MQPEPLGERIRFEHASIKANNEALDHDTNDRTTVYRIEKRGPEDLHVNGIRLCNCGYFGRNRR